MQFIPQPQSPPKIPSGASVLQRWQHAQTEAPPSQQKKKEELKAIPRPKVSKKWPPEPEPETETESPKLTLLKLSSPPATPPQKPPEAVVTKPTAPAHQRVVNLKPVKKEGSSQPLKGQEPEFELGKIKLRKASERKVPVKCLQSRKYQCNKLNCPSVLAVSHVPKADFVLML